MQRRQIGKGPHKRFSGLLLESLEDRHLPSGVANLIVQPPAAADSRSSTPPVASPTAQAAPSSSGASQTSASAQNQSNSYFPTTQPPDSTPWTASASSAAQNPSASSSATSQQNQGPYAPGSGTTNPASTMSNPGNGRSTPTYNDPTPTDTNGNVYSGQTYYPRPSPEYQQPVINLDSTLLVWGETQTPAWGGDLHAAITDKRPDHTRAVVTPRKLNQDHWTASVLFRRNVPPASIRLTYATVTPAVDARATAV
jgi:hypothetical protein